MRNVNKLFATRPFRLNTPDDRASPALLFLAMLPPGIAFTPIKQSRGSHGRLHTLAPRDHIYGPLPSQALQASVRSLCGGLILLFAAIILSKFGLIDGALKLLPNKVASTGFELFDPFKCITAIMSSRVAGLGLIIMAAAGYARYMSLIGASARMADYLSKPLSRLNSPYLVLALSYFVVPKASVALKHRSASFWSDASADVSAADALRIP